MKIRISYAAVIWISLVSANPALAQESDDFWSGGGFDEVADEAERIATAQRAAEKRAKERRRAQQREAREEAERVARIEARERSRAEARRRAEVTAARNRAYANSPILNAHNALQNSRRQQSTAQQSSSSRRYVPRPRNEPRRRNQRSSGTDSRLVIHEVDNSERIARERRAEAEYQRAVRERNARDERRREELRRRIASENADDERAAEEARRNKSKVYVEPTGQKPD